MWSRWVRRRSHAVPTDEGEEVNVGGAGVVEGWRAIPHSTHGRTHTVVGPSGGGGGRGGGGVRSTKRPQVHPIVPPAWAQLELFLSRPPTQTGATLLKQRVLEHAGLTVKMIPWYIFQYHEENGTADEYIRALAASACPSTAMPPDGCIP